MRRGFLISFAIVLGVVGVWDHDWRMILAGVSVATIWPVIRPDVHDVAHEQLLDDLWDDEEAA